MEFSEGTGKLRERLDPASGRAEAGDPIVELALVQRLHVGRLGPVRLPAGVGDSRRPRGRGGMHPTGCERIDQQLHGRPAPVMGFVSSSTWRKFGLLHMTPSSSKGRTQLATVSTSSSPIGSVWPVSRRRRIR